MVRDNECSSFPGFELSEVFMRIKGPKKIDRDNKSSSYPVFELPGVHCTYICT